MGRWSLRRLDLDRIKKPLANITKSTQITRYGITFVTKDSTVIVDSIIIYRYANNKDMVIPDLGIHRIFDHILSGGELQNISHLTFNQANQLLQDLPKKQVLL